MLNTQKSKELIALETFIEKAKQLIQNYDQKKGLFRKTSHLLFGPGSSGARTQLIVDFETHINSLEKLKDKKLNNVEQKVTLSELEWFLINFYHMSGIDDTSTYNVPKYYGRDPELSGQTYQSIKKEFEGCFKGIEETYKIAYREGQNSASNAYQKSLGTLDYGYYNIESNKDFYIKKALESASITASENLKTNSTTYTYQEEVSDTENYVDASMFSLNN